tara:strand:- start:441 stop:821 length:381 start_codon:yes stop_codon:yes gene_type:complete
MKKSEEAYKSIGEVAKILDLTNKKDGSLSTHTIRFWEKQFKTIKPKIFAGNRRYYNSKTIALLKEIKFLLKNKGMTIKGVQKILENKSSIKLDDSINKSINMDKNLVLKKKITKISRLIKDIKKLK